MVVWLKKDRLFLVTLIIMFLIFLCGEITMEEDRKLELKHTSPPPTFSTITSPFVLKGMTLYKTEIDKIQGLEYPRKYQLIFLSISVI